MREAASDRRAGGLLLTLATVVALVAVGCNQAQVEHEAAMADSKAVSFESADGVHLEGRLFGDGQAGVVLSHMLPADQSSWWDFARILSEQGYLVLTFDFRGYCPGGDAGCSGGEKNISAIWQDVLGAIDYVQSQGALTVELVGASMGGTASLVAASEAGGDISAVVTLSAPVSIEGLGIGPEALSRFSAGKLYIAGVGDATAADAAQQLYDLSPPPKHVEILPSDAHGTDLLTSNQSEVVRTLILNYLDQFSDTG
jgi:pimeloyl-ACP methyl ester carboxylesterase